MLDQDLRTSPLSPALIRLYGKPGVGRRPLAVASRLEGGPFFSRTMRLIMARFHQVEIGAYSYGPCFDPSAFPGGARVGRYVSMASGVKRRLDHPLGHLVLHPFLYNDKLGYVPSRTISHEPIEIGHDAWIGENVIFTERCRRVGIGAAIGAGSVVTRDVRDFEVVAGTPARVIRRRFTDDVCERILASRWWERPVAELARHAAELNVPVALWPLDHPVLVPGPIAAQAGG